MVFVDEENNPIEEARKYVKSELDDSARSLKEITLMIEQSQVEVNKLTQRNAAITTHLQQVQSQGNVTAQEMRMAYDSALDAQQRLLVMRSQLEKLQNDRSHLEQHRALLDKMKGAIDSASDMGGSASPVSAPKGEKSSVETIIQAQESERQRLSRQMHDGPAQALSNFILQADIAVRLFDVDQAQAKDELSNLRASAMSTLQKVRNFIFELRPMMLDDLGLVPTIKRYADTFKEQANIEINLSVTGQERRLESYVEVMIFRALQELLGNASRHSDASLIKVLVDMGESVIKVSVDDNGKGFDTDSLEKGSLGLNLIRERVEMMGGNFEIDSVIGKGTRVIFTLPALAAAVTMA